MSSCHAHFVPVQAVLEDQQQAPMDQQRVASCSFPSLFLLFPPRFLYSLSESSPTSCYHAILSRSRSSCPRISTTSCDRSTTCRFLFFSSIVFLVSIFHFRRELTDQLLSCHADLARAQAVLEYQQQALMDQQRMNKQNQAEAEAVRQSHVQELVNELKEKKR